MSAPLARHRFARLSLAIALSTTALPLFAADPPSPQQPTVEDLERRLRALEQRYGAAPANDDEAASVADLDQRLRILERRLELQEETATAKTASTPVVAITPEKGLSIKSADGNNEIRFRGLVQADGRFFIGDDEQPQNDTFLLRRVRPTIEGTWGKWIGFRITPEFAGDSATLVDAYIDLKFDPRATVRAGKFTAPVGLERLQSSATTALIENGFPTELVPNRDIGVQLQGEFAKGAVSYAVGVFNGTVDGRDAITANPDNELETAARIFFEPWKNSGNALSGLGFGISATSGDKRGTGNNFLPRYRTPGQATFFNYRSAVAADGDHTRWSPQAWYYRNSLGLLGEYVSSKQEVVLPANGTRADLDHRAWQVVGSYVLTGEDASYRGVTRPNHPFTPGGAGWGAFEIAARYGRLTLDDDAFPLFADPTVAAQEATSWGLGLNWYLTANLKLIANYTQTKFDGGGANGDREDEKAFFTRAQVSF